MPTVGDSTIMRTDEEPALNSLAGANDNRCLPIASPRVEAALRRIARLIGRQMAGEAFEARSAANDNAADRSRDT